MKRRGFLGMLLAGAAGLAAARPADGLRPETTADGEGPGERAPSPSRGDRSGQADTSGRMPARPLGSTGVELPILGLGGYHLGRAGSEKAARELIETALAEGVRFLDTAESYQDGRSESWIGAGLRGARDRVFLMTKTHAPRSRSAESARRHLEGSLERLRTDRLDLWQLHSVKSEEDVDRAFAPGGAMESLLEAKRTGLVRFVGVTGHAHPRANLRALHHFDRGLRFDAMQMPLNPVDAHQASFQREVLPGLAARGIGVIAMKTSAQAALLREGLCSIEECLRFVWSLPVCTAVVGMETPQLVRDNARLARGFTPMSAAERGALLERLRPEARLSLEWYKRA